MRPFLAQAAGLGETQVARNCAKQSEWVRSSRARAVTVEHTSGKLEAMKNPDSAPDHPRRFLSVADQMATMIANGGFRAGDRLPSVRALGRDFRVGPSTALAAYGELERRGTVEARPRSGFYVTAGLREASDAPNRLSSLLGGRDVTLEREAATQILMATGHERGVLALDTASPHADLTPHEEFRALFGRALRRHTRDAMGYIFPPGYLPLRRAIARRLVASGSVTSPDDVVVTSGGTEAILLSLRATTEPGDTVAIESPTYYGVLQAMENLGLRPLEVATDRSAGMDPDALGRAIRRRRVAACFLMPSFSNPLGGRMPADRLEAIVGTLKKADIPLIEDDANGELGFNTQRPRVASSYAKRGHVLLCGTISKTLAPGCRIGWVVPGAYRDRVMKLQWTTTIAPNSAAQIAVAEYFASAAYDRHLRRLRLSVAESANRMTRVIRASFPPGTTCIPPEGGLVVWVELPRAVSATRLHRIALEQRVAIMPGTLFSPRAMHNHHIRLNAAVPWNSSLEDALRRVGKIATSLA
jgi:DNA-binding transcriptional MocR family regulator